MFQTHYDNMKIPPVPLAFCESSDLWSKMSPRSYDTTIMTYKCINDIKIKDICYIFSIAFLLNPFPVGHNWLNKGLKFIVLWEMQL